MKKNISINLQGVIFHIEEDAYDMLSNYLAAVKNYFASYEGHNEITADIEARIAELFMAKLSPAKQVITSEDVQALIAQMGSVADFEVMEDEIADLPPYTSAAGASTGGSYQQTTGSATYTEPTRRFFRDGSRKMLGGVAAGIANYLAMDPLWIRIAFVFLVIGLPFTGGISGFGILAYIILWIALPETYTLPETPVKKLYRDPDDKKLGGVCSGLGLYFGTDPSIIRIIFLILFLVFGIGLMLYILLWILVPEAKTLTEKMQMQGNPVTLSGIENSLKKNLNLRDENGQESTVTKLLLFPIRLISQIIEWLARNLKPFFSFLITLIRIFAGVMLLMVACACLLALGLAFMTGLGVHFGSDALVINDMPVEISMLDLPLIGLISGFIAGLIPTLMLFMLAIGLLSRRFYMRATVGWSLFAVWLLSLIIFLATLASYQKNFRRTGEFSRQTVVAAPYETITLDAHETGLDYDHDLNFEIKSHSGPDIIIRENYTARGTSEENARKNAQMLMYRLQQRDSAVVFDDAKEFKPNAVYRNQELTVTINLPESKRYRITESMAYLLPSSAFEHHYSKKEIGNNLWMAKNNLLICLTCPAGDSISDNYPESDLSYDPGDEAKENLIGSHTTYGTDTRDFRISGFKRIDAGGNLHIRVTQGPEYSIKARGPKNVLKKLEIEKDGNSLSMGMKRSFMDLSWRDKPVLIEITMPALEAADLSGAVVTEIRGFSGPEFVFDGSGAVRSIIQVNATSVVVDLSGACNTTFTGKTDKLIAEASGASKINARNLEARVVTIEASGASNATVHANQSLTAEANGASSIYYYGNPSDTSLESNGPSSISKR